MEKEEGTQHKKILFFVLICRLSSFSIFFFFSLLPYSLNQEKNISLFCLF